MEKKNNFCNTKRCCVKVVSQGKVVSHTCSNKKSFCPIKTKRVCKRVTQKTGCSTHKCCQLKIRNGKQISKTCQKSKLYCPTKRNLKCKQKKFVSKLHGSCKSNSCCSFKFNFNNKSWSKDKSSCYRTIYCNKKPNEKRITRCKFTPFNVSCRQRKCCTRYYIGKVLKSKGCRVLYKNCPLKRRKICQRKFTKYGCSHIECRNTYLRNGKIVSTGVSRNSKFSCPIITKRKCETIKSKKWKMSFY